MAVTLHFKDGTNVAYANGSQLMPYSLDAAITALVDAAQVPIVLVPTCNLQYADYQV